MISIKPHLEGCLLSIRAQPGAQKNSVVGEHGDSLKVAVTAPPEDGRANEAIEGLLRKWLGLKRGDIELWNGARSRDKQFLIRGVNANQLLELIQKTLA
jgi:uncharacterized protein (TIGR00251 family)